MGVPTWISWSSGKDAAWVLERLLDDDKVELSGLLTTIADGRIPFQGTGRELLELQAAATGLPLTVVEIPPGASNDQWLDAMRPALQAARDAGVEQLAFGDLHLQDLRDWREEVFSSEGMQTLFPLWGANTAELAAEMIEGGLQARISCVDPASVDGSWLGKPFDHDFVAALGDDTDPCGENGEFHTFVCGGPMMHDTLDVSFAEPFDDRGFLVAEPVLAFPLDGTLDLHGIPPKQVGDLVDDWIEASRAAGLTRLRIVHGKGIGALRETVHARLRRRSDVATFSLGGEGGGSWGATVVELKD